MANVVGSFFKCFVSSGALTRSIILESSGGKTQLVTIIASLVVLNVILWISPVLESLPKAALGSIIIAAVVSLFKQLKDLPYYWKLDKLDFATWVVTFLCTVFLEVDVGLLAGLMTLLCLNTYRNQNLRLNVLGQVNDYEIHSNIKRYKSKEYEKVKIFAPTHSLFYINIDFFREELIKRCPLKPHVTTGKDKAKGENKDYDLLLAECCASPSLNESKVEMNLTDELKPSDKNDLKAIIIDCTSCNYIDESGAKGLKEISDKYEKNNVKFLLTNCNDRILDFLKKMNFFKDYFDNIIYLTNKDALLSCDL
jgi:MFS superfamily sulfate permease-like transporter